MNSEQQEYINLVNQSSDNEIFIKETGREGISMLKHSHNKHQIIYTASGTLHIQTGSTSYFVPERHIAWIPGNTEHELSSNNRQISLQIFYCNLGFPQIENGQAFSVYHTNTIILENLKFISSSGSVIRKSHQADLYNYTISFFRLLPTMSLGYRIPLQALVIPADIRLIPVLKYINEHLHEELSMERLAEQFGFSVRNLSRLFLKSGIRYSNYLNYQRITRAIELFADGDKTMQQIAYKVGFNTPNNFNRVFKQTLGISPGTFCKKL